MIKRRSLDDALMSPEEEAFLSGNGQPVKESIQFEADALKSESALTEPKAEAPIPTVLADETQTPAGMASVPFNSRIDPAIMTELIRASGDRKAKRIRPYTQKDILSAALNAWLKENGYSVKR